MIFSAIKTAKKISFKNLPDPLIEPEDYYSGIEDLIRPKVSNVIVFQRKSVTTLQQRNFSNRFHHRYVLISVLETSGTLLLDGTEIPLQEGQSILISPFQFHHYINLKNEALRWLFITFELENNQSVLKELDYRVLQSDQTSIQLMRTIVHAWNASEDQKRRSILQNLDHLLSYFINRITKETPEKHASPSSWVAMVESLVIQSVFHQWTIETIAHKVGLSERRLRTLFHEKVGISISRYRATYQLHRAISHMRDQKLTHKKIAELCGFNSSAVFSRFIRRETGLTPTALRNARQ